MPINHSTRWVLAAACAAAGSAQAGEAEVRASVQAMVPNAKIESIAPIDGGNTYEAVIDGQIVYVSADGKNLFTGEVWRVADKSNLTSTRKDALRRDTLAAVGAERRIVFEAENPRHTITVFTDFDCGYCRKLHHDIAQYNAAGVTVEYLLYPRGGANSPSFDKAVSVWCAVDREQAFTLAKAGTDPEPKHCENDLETNYALGARMGFNGTPAVIDEKGHLQGYLPPERMIAWLDGKTTAAN